jgi:hypothetical protein
MSLAILAPADVAGLVESRPDLARFAGHRRL